MSNTGVLPRCTKCNSLERHRAIRDAMLKLRGVLLFDKMRVLQFSQDRSVEADWFAHHEVSVYSGSNSLDLEAINRPDGSYDMIICNHVLEHVPRDGLALREMLRVVGTGGIVFLSVPSPHRSKKTRDWGYPDWNQHGHIRIYGLDILQKLDEWAPNTNYLMLKLCDRVTEVEESAFLITNSDDIFAKTLKNISADMVYPTSQDFQLNNQDKFCSD